MKLKVKATYGGYKVVAQNGVEIDPLKPKKYIPPATTSITPIEQMQGANNYDITPQVEQPKDYSGSVNTINNIANSGFEIYNKFNQIRGRLANGVSNGIAAVSGLASMFDEAQLRRDENQKRIESLQGTPYENSNRGLNNIPAYTKYGGGPGSKVVSESANVSKKQLKGKPLTEDQIYSLSEDKLGEIYTKDKYPEANINYHTNENSLLKTDNSSARAYNWNNNLFIKQGDPQDLQAELAHTKQFRGMSDIQSLIRSGKDLINTNGNYERTYDVNGSLENEAHAIIEPQIKKDYDKYTLDLLQSPYSKTTELPKLLGTIKRQNGGYGTNVEAEKGEVFDNNGDILKIDDDANSHEQGGVNIQADRVLENTSTTRKDSMSKALKIDKEQITEMSGFKAKRAMSHSDAYEFEAKKNAEQQDKLLKAISKVTGSKISDKYAIESGKLNVDLGLAQLPSENQIFDKYFNNQEKIKNEVGFYDSNKAQYGKGEDGYINPYRKGKQKTPTGLNSNFPGTDNAWEGYRNIWQDNLGKKYSDDYGGTYELQNDSYSWALENDPQSVRDMWKTYGLNNKAKQNGITYDTNNLTDEQLASLKNEYVDGLSGARMLQPKFGDNRLGPIDPLQPKSVTPLATPGIVTPTIPQTAAQKSVVNNPLSAPKNPEEFNQPLEWYDTIGPASTILSALRRDPELYNPVNVNQLKLQQQDVRPALNNSQAEYNSAIQNLGNDSIGAAQKAQIFSNKLRQDNQTIGQYENQNKQIQNQETQYNANARDRQEAANAQSRESFYTKVLQGRAKQEEQLLTGIDAMAKTFAENRAFNKNANLIMKLAPNFNAKGDYNGVPVTMGSSKGTTSPTINEKGQYLIQTTDSNGKKVDKYVDKSIYETMTKKASSEVLQNKMLMDMVGRKK